MRVLVTGGAGFIGSGLVDRLLAEGHRVDVVDDLSSGALANLADARRSAAGQLRFHQLDIRSEATGDLLERCRPEVVYHLAASAPAADLLHGAEVDVIGSLRVLEGARRSGSVKVVVTSGAGLYGPVDADDLPVRESQALRPVTPAGVAAKAVADYLALYRDLHSLEYSVLVLGSVYGPRDRSGVVARFARALVDGEPCVVSGDGRQTRDFVYIDDVVDALARAAERGGGLVLNVGTGRETAIADLYRMMAAAAGVDRPALAGPARDPEMRRSGLDAGRAAIHLGWKPWTPVAEGVRAVLDATRQPPAR